MDYFSESIKELDSFKKQKSDLSVSKSRIDDLSPEQYNIYKRELEERSFSDGNFRFNLEKFMGAPKITLTSAKFVEMIQKEELIPSDHSTTNFHVFCNSEVNGAIPDLVSRLSEIWYGLPYGDTSKIDWRACAQGRIDFMIDADNDKFGMYSSYEEKWLTVPCDSANAKSINAIKTKILKKWPDGVDLYTADGGIDVSINYNAQEDIITKMAFGQIITGLLTLKPGGNMVTRQFTFFELFSRHMLYLLNDAFDTVKIVKPQTSKSNNSEIYLVCKGYHPLPQLRLDTLISVLNMMKDFETLIVGRENDDCTGLYDEFAEKISKRNIQVEQSILYKMRRLVDDQVKELDRAFLLLGKRNPGGDPIPEKEVIARAWFDQFKLTPRRLIQDGKVHKYSPDKRTSQRKEKFSGGHFSGGSGGGGHSSGGRYPFSGKYAPKNDGRPKKCGTPADGGGEVWKSAKSSVSSTGAWGSGSNSVATVRQSTD